MFLYSPHQFRKSEAVAVPFLNKGYPRGYFWSDPVICLGVLLLCSVDDVAVDLYILCDTFAYRASIHQSERIREF